MEKWPGEALIRWPGFVLVVLGRPRRRGPVLAVQGPLSLDVNSVVFFTAVRGSCSRDLEKSRLKS